MQNNARQSEKWDSPCFPSPASPGSFLPSYLPLCVLQVKNSVLLEKIFLKKVNLFSICIIFLPPLCPLIVPKQRALFLVDSYHLTLLLLYGIYLYNSICFKTESSLISKGMILNAVSEGKEISNRVKL